MYFRVTPYSILILMLFISGCSTKLGPTVGAISYGGDARLKECRVNYHPTLEEDFERVGIGANINRIDDVVYIKKIVPGGPTANVGSVMENDVLIALEPCQGYGYVDVSMLSLAEVVSLIRGERYSNVKLKISRNNAIREVVIVRNRVGRN